MTNEPHNLPPTDYEVELDEVTRFGLTNLQLVNFPSSFFRQAQLRNKGNAAQKEEEKRHPHHPKKNVSTFFATAQMQKNAKFHLATTQVPRIK